MDGLYYRWKAGDTIATVASRYGAASPDILNWPENTAQIGPAEKPDIQPGMLIFIPGGKMPFQPVATIPVASTPTPARGAGGLGLSALLKIFPLATGTRWVYTETTYTQAGDPNQIIRAVTSIADQVADVQNLPPYYIAHIQRETSLVSADPGFLEYNGTKTSLGSSEFWYILHAGRVYLSHERPDPTNLALDQLSEELDFPLTVGSSWCPNKIQKGSLTPEAETPVPCASSAGVRKVLAEESYTTQAGKFEPCYQMSDFYNSGSPIRVFCEGVGFVAEKYDHAGSRFGYSQELVQFLVPAASLTTPTAPTTATQSALPLLLDRTPLHPQQADPAGLAIDIYPMNQPVYPEQTGYDQVQTFLENASCWGEPGLEIMAGKRTRNRQSGSGALWLSFGRVLSTARPDSIQTL